jgi:rare lipoprotein A
MRLNKAAGVPAATITAFFFLASTGIDARASAQSPQYAVGAPYRIKGRRYVPRANPNYERTGVASWYGRRFHGRRTANGERYNMHAMTAAHPTLPLSAFVHVTNLDNGRSIVVRINDRGPFARGRIIDLSRAGARALGFEERGTARVRVAIIATSSQTAERADREPATAFPPRPTWE